MEEKQKFPSHKSSGKILVASLFILSGALLFARNMGLITYELFDVVVSWQSLLIILGIYSMVHRHYIGGTILVLVGAYFLIGGLSWLPENSQAMLWPLALVLIGILFLVKSRSRERWVKQHMREHMREHVRRGRNFASASTEAGDTDDANTQQCESDNGFLRSNNTFGAVRHVVLDEVFKGASIRTSFGGTTIDLRHTHLPLGETYIDLDCSCGGVELFIPADWKVVIKCNAFFGGCEDKRWQGANINQDCILIIRGNVSLGGLEIKD
ncbi:LiaF transmembrane domain-containing protein [Bacteroides sp.]|uniref:LiaF transmembrane domain-containing protein n=1 Tax=Bacteroides sp. TaxID=29523 RepID=UPI003AB683DE